MQNFSILLAEPSPLLREKIAGVLGRMDHVWCIGQVAGPADLLRAARTLQPDLILADLKILSTTDLMSEVRQAAPVAQIIGLVDTMGSPYSRRAMEMGLDGICARIQLIEEIQHWLRFRRDHPRGSPDPSQAV